MFRTFNNFQSWLAPSSIECIPKFSALGHTHIFNLNSFNITSVLDRHFSIFSLIISEAYRRILTENMQNVKMLNGG